MKNNKLTTKLLSFVAAIALVFTMSSCNQELMETTYTPDNNNVTFSVASAKYALEGDPLVVTVQRGVAKEAINVNLTLEDANGVYTLSSNTVSFAAGEYTKQVSLSYDITALKPVVEYNFTLSFDAKDKAASGWNKFSGVAQVPLVYQDYGEIAMIQGSFGRYMSVTKYKLQLANFTNNYYKIVGMYGSTTDLEFNIVKGVATITAPATSTYSALGAYPLAKFATCGMHPSYGQLTAWVDVDPNYFQLMNLSADGLLQVGSIIGLDAFYTVSAGYFGWYTDGFQVTAIK
ncbi:MAG: hypothetical protein Q4B21_00760 [Bacteroidia bacterium]|nr:hypothetical protein [Bacteroidia bacterium]